MRYTVHQHNSDIFLSPVDSDCGHKIKRCLFLGGKSMIHIDNIIKSRDISLPTKIHLVKAMVFPVVKRVGL